MCVCVIGGGGVVGGRFRGRGPVVQEVDVVQRAEGRKMPIYEQMLMKQDGRHA